MSESPSELKDMAGMRNRIKTAMKRKSCCDYLYIKIAVKKCIALNYKCNTITSTRILTIFILLISSDLFLLGLDAYN